MNSLKISIRHAVSEDAVSISQLLNRLAAKFLMEDINEEGAETLGIIFAPKSISEKLMSNTYDFFVAELEGEIAGNSVIKNNNHLYHLFVAEQYHGHGLATSLWNKARTYSESRGNPGKITVNSSSYAVEFYKKLGFEPTGDAVWEEGLRSTPMVWNKIKKQERSGS